MCPEWTVEEWRREWDSNPRYGFPYGGFQDRCHQPLGHPSGRPQYLTASRCGPSRRARAGLGSASGAPRCSHVSTGRHKRSRSFAGAHTSLIAAGHARGRPSCPRFRHRVTEVVTRHMCITVPKGHTTTKKPQVFPSSPPHTGGERALPLGPRDFSCSLPPANSSHVLVRGRGAPGVLRHAIGADTDVERQH